MNSRFQEKRTLFQWINMMIPYIYTIGILLILVWMATSSLIIGISTWQENPKAFFLQEIEVDNSNTVQTVQETTFSLIIKPFVESNFNQVIFRGLFLLFIWFLLFLIIPVAFKRLKRFKFLNLEFEVDNIEQAAIETVEISGTKAKLMAYFTGDDASGRTLEFLFRSAIDFKEVLEYFLEETQIGYKNQPINGAFSFAVYTGDTPEKFVNLIDESKETGEAVVFNRTDDLNVWKKNYLVYYFAYDNLEFTTVIESFTYSFDIIDKYLFELLHKTIAKNIENIEYMVALTNSESIENQ
ncbi:MULTISPECIES: hypothetical protein [unclassified Psychrobacillus]|uniref:hypothetical protein n=1 Tax=unclassified Psychrobacillus TaxID=2636677 RepID=UPI00119D238D